MSSTLYNTLLFAFLFNVGETQLPRDYHRNSDLTIAWQWVQYQICDPSIFSVMERVLQPAHYNKGYLMQVCAFLSYPEMRGLLGENFNPAWFPTKGKLIRGVVFAALKFKELSFFPRVMESLKEFMIFINMKGYEATDMREIAVPLGIVPPRLSQYRYLPILLDFVNYMEPNKKRADFLKSLLSSGRLKDYIWPQFDASHCDTYRELMSNIFSHLNYNHESIFWLAEYIERYMMKISKISFGDQIFNPQLIYELNLPPTSPLHDPFIKELIFTTIDPYYHKITKILEARLNDGQFMGVLDNFDFRQYNTKAELMGGLLDAYALQVKEPDIEEGDHQIVFLARNTSLNPLDNDPIDQELLAALLGIRKELNTLQCRQHSHFLIDSLQYTVPITIIPLCEFLNTMDPNTIFGHQVNVSQFSNNGALLIAAIEQLKKMGSEWYNVLKTYKDKIRI